jgi:hypothetical protein
MTPFDDDRLVAFGDIPALAGIWSVVVLVVLATAVCM